MVSIIIPTYNYGKYLTETLQSVKNQSFRDWECIVIDDGSTDNTKEIVDIFISEDSRYKYIYQANKGVSSARNIGIKAASGDFIQFLDGDDLLQIDKIKSQIDAFEKYPLVDIVYNEVRFFDDENIEHLKTSLTGKKQDDWMPKVSANGKEVVALFSKINFIVTNAPLLKKSVFEKVGYFNETMKALEDWDFWMRCALANCYFHFNETENAFALVRVHQGSISTITKLMNNGNFIFLQHTLSHKNLSLKYSVILFSKYVELFWDSVFTKFYFAFNPVILAIVSISLLPFYGIIKLIRIFK